jgi:N-acetylglucosamine kinase-like BadF-type ATPase
MYVLGLDVGGTKTVCLLADEAGRVIAEARARGVSLHGAGELEVEKVLHLVMSEALGARRIDPAAVCIGIAGADRRDDAEAIRGIMGRLGSRMPTLVVNDAVIALTAAAGQEPGVVVVAGTGSIAYGRDGRGRAARSGGWGYLLGDEGSGFWIGRAALMAVLRQHDGRGPGTLLSELVVAELGLADPSALVHAVYGHPAFRTFVTGVARIVRRAAEAGDAVAADIVGRAASELAGAAASVVTRLGMRGDAFPTVLAGGVFQGVPALVDLVAARLTDVAPRSTVRRLDVEPALGAVSLALAAAAGHVTIPAYV